VAAVRYTGRDTDDSVRVYVERLGFTLVTRMGPAFAIVERDGFELWPSGPQTSAAQPMPDGLVPAPGGWNRLVLEVDDVHKALARLGEEGERRRNDPISGPGGTQVVIEDPSGNPIELFAARFVASEPRSPEPLGLRRDTRPRHRR
jgi:catechol 2,3-dioxygenase-like lactoylglutathione lyase family enzyme